MATTRRAQIHSASAEVILLARRVSPDFGGGEVTRREAVICHDCGRGLIYDSPALVEMIGRYGCVDCRVDKLTGKPGHRARRHAEAVLAKRDWKILCRCCGARWVFGYPTLTRPCKCSLLFKCPRCWQCVEHCGCGD